MRKTDDPTPAEIRKLCLQILRDRGDDWRGLPRQHQGEPKPPAKPKLYEALRATERVAGEESQSAIMLRTELQRRLNAGLTDSWDDHMIDLLLRVEPMDVSEVVAHVIIPWFERMLSVWEPLGYHDQLLLACLRCYVNCCGLFAYQELDNGEVEVTERTKQLIRDCHQALEAYGNDR